MQSEVHAIKHVNLGLQLGESHQVVEGVLPPPLYKSIKGYYNYSVLSEDRFMLVLKDLGGVLG